MINDFAVKEIKSLARQELFQAILAGFCVFAIIASLLIKDHYSLCGKEKSTNVYVYLASSFLQGKLDIDPSFPNERDLCPFNNKMYALYLPTPAFMLMPFVIRHGLYIGDRWLNVFLVGVSVAVSWLMMKVVADRSGFNLSMWYKILLTIFVAFGTSFLILSIEDSHWYMAQVTAAAMMFLSLFFLCKNKDEKPWLYLLSGIFWGLALMARLHLVLSFPIFLYVVLFGTRSIPDIASLKEQVSKKVRNLICLVAPVVLVLSFLSWYNWSRFGSAFETGVAYHLMEDRLKPDFKKFGYMHPHFFLYNAYYTLLRIPLFEHQNLFREPNHGATTTKGWSWTEGYSIFFQSPLILYALWALRQIKKDWLIGISWLSAIPVCTIALCMHGPGNMQFGARYLFDSFALLFPLIIIGSKGKVTPLFVLLVLASVAVNAWGLHLFGTI